MSNNLICYCGNKLVSNGHFWYCPAKGSGVIATEKEKVHQGVIVLDKRPTMTDTMGGRRA
jgi:hypothetical protein